MLKMEWGAGVRRTARALLEAGHELLQRQDVLPAAGGVQVFEEPALAARLSRRLDGVL